MIEQFITDILAREGGYVDDPADRGGATNFGITQAVYEDWKGRSVTKEEIRNMPRSDARQIYEAQYVQPWMFAIDWTRIFEHLLDMGVNHGIGGASRILQRALKVKADGQVGPMTKAAFMDADKSYLPNRLIAERAIYYAQIVESNPTQSRFIEGWIRRCMSFLTGEH